MTFGGCGLWLDSYWAPGSGGHLPKRVQPELSASIPVTPRVPLRLSVNHKLPTKSRPGLSRRGEGGERQTVQRTGVQDPLHLDRVRMAGAPDRKWPPSESSGHIRGKVTHTGTQDTCSWSCILKGALGLPVSRCALPGSGCDHSCRRTKTTGIIWPVPEGPQAPCARAERGGGGRGAIRLIRRRTSGSPAACAPRALPTAPVTAALHYGSCLIRVIK